VSTGRRIAGVLVLGAALLLCEIRFEHREVLGGTWRGWIPLGYCALLLGAGIPAWLSWNRGGRKVLAAVFAAAMAIGLLGAWFHADGRPFRTLARVARTFIVPPGEDGGVKTNSGPPPLAPLAFCGLGALGLLACTSDERRVSPREYPEHTPGPEAREPL